MPRHSFIQMTKLPDVRGRVDYISNPKRQEHLYAIYSTVKPEFWKYLSEQAQYDYNYYQRILNDDFDDDTDEEINSKKGLQLDSRFVGDVAKSVLMSGNITPVGIVKGVSKATKKQIRRNATKGIGEKIKDELGLTDLEDEFTEMGNELREEFGLKPKMTHKMEREQQIHDAFNETVKKARKEILLRSSIVAQERTNSYKFCPFCGTKLSSDKVKYCTECGQKLN